MLVEVGICQCWGSNGKKRMLGLDGGSCQALLVIPLLIYMSVNKQISFLMQKCPLEGILRPCRKELNGSEAVAVSVCSPWYR